MAVELSLAAAWERMQLMNPLIQCVTNFVTPQRVADVLLAAGASPAMIDHADEVGDFAAIASAVYVNFGLHAAQIPALAAITEWAATRRGPGETTDSSSPRKMMRLRRTRPLRAIRKRPARHRETPSGKPSRRFLGARGGGYFPGAKGTPHFKMP